MFFNRLIRSRYIALFILWPTTFRKVATWAHGGIFSHFCQQCGRVAI
jgi:hypothetical protein